MTVRRRPPGRLTLVPIPDPPERQCAGCAGPMLAAGTFTIEVEGRGQLCNVCLAPYVPNGLRVLAHALDVVAEHMTDVEHRSRSTARQFLVDACLALTASDPPLPVDRRPPISAPLPADPPSARGTGTANRESGAQAASGGTLR